MPSTPMGDANSVKIRESADADGGAYSTWKVNEVPYTQDGPYGRRSAGLPIKGFSVRRVLPTVNHKLKEYHSAPEEQYVIQLKGDGVEVACSDGSVETLYATCISKVSDLKSCGHTSEPLSMRERISLFIPVDQ